MDAPAAYWEHLRQRQGTLRGCLQAQRAQGWRAWNRSVPQLLVLVGLEGAGHHALQPLLRHVARNHPNTTVVDRVQEYVAEDAARLVSPSRHASTTSLYSRATADISWPSKSPKHISLDDSSRRRFAAGWREATASAVTAAFCCVEDATTSSGWLER